MIDLCFFEETQLTQSSLFFKLKSLTSIIQRLLEIIFKASPP